MSTPAPETPTGHHDLSIEKVSKRADDIEGKLPKVAALYARAGKPDKQFGPPAKPAAS